jgi:hypothetical protein
MRDKERGEIKKGRGRGELMGRVVGRGRGLQRATCGEEEDGGGARGNGGGGV